MESLPQPLPFTPDGVITPSTRERIEELINRGQDYEQASRSANTLRSYLSDWRQFVEWAADMGAVLPDDPDELTEPVGADWVYLYVVEAADRLKPPTIARHLSAIRHWHHRQDFPSPTSHPRLTTALAGINRSHSYTKRQARPFYLDDLRMAIAMLGGSPKEVRDRALLLTGWWGALRRSELVGLDVGDLEDHPEGILITLRRSKTDQEAAGRAVPIHYHDPEVDPVMALRDWLRVGERAAGPVFVGVNKHGQVSSKRLSTQAVADVVKAAAESIGFDPSGYSAHSLRSGFVSECDRRAIASSAVRLTTGHKTDAMLATYTRPRTLFESAAGAFFNGDDEPALTLDNES